MRPLRVVDVHPLHSKRGPHAHAAAQVGLIRANHLQHLKPSTLVETILVRGQKSVQSGRAAVLRLVDDAALPVDRHRLMDESPHRLERRRHGLARRGHLEDPAVRLVVHVERLLAREPALGVRGAARTVGGRSREARPGLVPLPPANVECQVGRSAARIRVVDDRPVGRIGRGASADLVIADEHETAMPGVHDGHTVMCRRRQDAIVHGIARPPERDVAESVRQHDERQPGVLVGDRRQRPVTRGRLPRQRRPGERL